MALTYQLNRLRPNPIQGGLQNAIELYEMAYGLAIQLSSDRRSRRIILTALNNLGLIKHELGEFEASKMCLKDLTLYIRFLRSQSSQEMDTVHLADLYECMLNAMILRNEHHCAGAA